MGVLGEFRKGVQLVKMANASIHHKIRDKVRPSKVPQEQAEETEASTGFFHLYVIENSEERFYALK